MIIVSGGAGFIGSNLVRSLLDDGYPVQAVDNLSFSTGENLPKKAKLIVEDFNNILPNGGGDKDVLVHCATSNIIYAQDHPVDTFKNNAEKTIELFRRFRGKIVYISTCSVYGNAKKLPTTETAPIRVYNAYDTSKRVAELYLGIRGTYTTLRLSNVYGEYQQPSNPYCGVIGRLVDCALNRKVFTMYGNGEDTRDYTYVGDVVRAIRLAITEPSTWQEINISTGVETSIIELIRMIGNLTGNPILVSEANGRSIDLITRRCIDAEKAKGYLGWKAETPLGAGLLKTIDWFKDAGLFKDIQK